MGLGQIENFKLRSLEEKLNEAAILLRKNNNKIKKAAYVGMISELINFFKYEYPELNREPIKKLLKDILDERLLKPDKLNDLKHNTKQKQLKISRKRRTDSLIVAAIELLVSDGLREQEAIEEASFLLFYYYFLVV